MEIPEELVNKSPAEIGKFYGLTDNETAAISNYISSGSYGVNEKLRKGLDLTADEAAQVRDLDRALKKMPSYGGTVYRSVPIDDVKTFLAGYVPGADKRYSWFISTGTHVYDESFSVQYIIESKTGRDLRAFNMQESEILFQRHSEFDVMKVSGNKIYLKEK